MPMEARIILPILLAALTAAVFIFLPPLRSCPLPGELRDRARKDAAGRPQRRITLAESAAVLAVTLLYALAAFRGLGDTCAPQSSHVFSEGESVTLDLGEERDIAAASVYCVIGTGGFELSCSPDGESWQALEHFEQNYVTLLKWHEPEISCRARYLRLKAWGAPELGELALYAADGTYLEYSGCAALCDERELVPDEPSFLNSSYFDEIYHARTALEHLRGMRPYEISHPPLGKLIIAAGMALFGVTPFGWRFSGALFGVLMLPLMYLFARRLFGRGGAALCTLLYIASDFMHLVQTRIATIDTYAVFFTILMYYFMLRWLLPDPDANGVTPKEGRPLDLALSGLFFGVGAACKWTCLYAGLGLGVAWAAHWGGRLVRERSGALDAFARNVGQCLVFFVAIPAAIYYAAYLPYGAADGLGGGLGTLFRGRYARIVLENQGYMFRYHSGVDATHPYSSRWYQWMLDIRPILYYLQYDGDKRSSFGAFVNPALCWAGLISLFPLGRCAVVRRDRAAAFILLGWFAQLVPWMFITRITFEYHYFPCTVFLALSLGYSTALLRGGGRRSALPGWALAAAAVALFVLFYPALTGAWLDRAAASSVFRWLPSWPL